MKKILILIFIMCLSSLIAKTPSWVNNRPLDNNYYIGIGYSSKVKGSNDHIEKAKNEALKNLASEITVNISGEIVSDMVEKSGLLEEELRSKITSTTQAELEGFEVVDEWQDKKQYYIYYRLSKEKYALQKQQKIANATDLSLDLFSKAKNSESNNEYDKALTFYLQALKPLDKFIGEPLIADYNGKSIYLSNEINSSLQNLLSNINLQAVNSKISAKRNSAVKTPLKVEAKIYDSEIPISNLPIAFSFTRGEGDIQNQVSTNMNGIASSRIAMLKSNDKMQFVVAKLDIQKLINQDDSSFIYQNMLQSFPIPETKFILSVAGLSFCIDSEETNLGKIMEVNQVEPKLKEALSSKGYSFTDDISNADFHIGLKARSREGSELYGMYSSFVDLTVSVTDMNSGEEIYQNVFNNISGQGLDYKKAGLKAFEKAAEEFVDDFIDVLQNKL